MDKSAGAEDKCGVAREGAKHKQKSTETVVGSASALALRVNTSACPRDALLGVGVANA